MSGFARFEFAPMKKPTTAPVTKPGKLPEEIRVKIEERNKILAWLAKGEAREMELRKELVSFFVPKPKEGTNTVAGEGYEVKVDHKVSRTLDVAALDSVMPQLPEHLRVIGTLISYAPRFDLKAYRAMSPGEKKIFEQALTIKDGAPSLEIILRTEEETVDPEKLPAQLAAAAEEAEHAEDMKGRNPSAAATKPKNSRAGVSARAAAPASKSNVPVLKIGRVAAVSKKLPVKPAVKKSVAAIFAKKPAKKKK